MISKLVSKALALSIIFSSTPIKADTDNQCIEDGKWYTIEGTVSLEVFPGPPNYKSIRDGDEERMYWILTAVNSFECGYKISMNSGNLNKVKGPFNRFQLGNYQVSREVLEEARNSNIRGDGLISLIGQAMFGHNSHHVTKVVLFNARKSK